MIINYIFKRLAIKFKGKHYITRRIINNTYYKDIIPVIVNSIYYVSEEPVYKYINVMSNQYKDEEYINSAEII